MAFWGTRRPRGAGLQAAGNELSCQPMVDEETGEGDGVDEIAGAVQLACPVSAPYQVPPPGDRHTSQQVPFAARSARVMLPPPTPLPPSAPAAIPLRPESSPDDDVLLPAMAMLTVSEFVDGPFTKVTEGFEAANVEG